MAKKTKKKLNIVDEVCLITPPFGVVVVVVGAAVEVSTPRFFTLQPSVVQQRALQEVTIMLEMFATLALASAQRPASCMEQLTIEPSEPGF